MLTESERQAAVERIARNIERFDDDTLAELDRLTDPESYKGSEVDPAVPEALSRRQLLVGLGAGAAVVAAAGIGTVAVVRGGSDERAEIEELRSLVELYARLEKSGLDDALRAALGSVGLAVEGARMTADAESVGLDLVQRALDSGAAGTDASLPLVLRQHVLEPGRALVAAVQSLEEAWSREMATPLEAKLSERYALRQRIVETGADSG